MHVQLQSDAGIAAACVMPSNKASKVLVSQDANPSGWVFETTWKREARKAVRRTEVLEGVVKVHVTDGDDDCVPVVPPVEAALLEPLKVAGFPDLLLYQVLCEHISRS